MEKNLCQNFSPFLVLLSSVLCPLCLHKLRNIMATNEHLFCRILFPHTRSESRKRKNKKGRIIYYSAMVKKNIFSLQTAVKKNTNVTVKHNRCWIYSRPLLSILCTLSAIIYVKSILLYLYFISDVFVFKHKKQLLQGITVYTLMKLFLLTLCRTRGGYWPKYLSVYTHLLFWNFWELLMESGSTNIVNVKKYKPCNPYTLQKL